MKTTFAILLLTSLSLWAQNTSAPASAGVPSSVSTLSNRAEQLRQLRREVRSAITNAPAVPLTNAGISSSLPQGVPRSTPIPRPASTVVPGSGPESTRPAATTPASAPASTGPGTPAATPVAPGSATPGTALPSPTVPGVTSAAPGPEQTIVITPPARTTNAAPEEVLPAGTINFPATDLNQVLQIYAELVNRTILRPTTLPAPTITLKTQTPLTKREAMQAFDAVLALNGISMINVGEKFVKAVPVAQANQEGAPFNKLDSTSLPEIGQYVTHVVQLTYTKPTEMVQALQPFAKIPNSILPIDSSQILVLRDYTENVKRMLEMIKEIDKAVPAEYISEVIPIKYALASEIASALNSLSSGGGGTSVGKAPTTSSRTGFGGGGVGGTMGGASGYRGGTMGQTPFGTQPGMAGATPTPGAGSFSDRLQAIIKRASVSGEIQVLGQTKIISDERTNSLLIFASREDMKMIKDIVSKLDVVLAQVLIEAVVMQVTLSDSMDLGVSWLEKKVHGSGDYSGIGAIGNTKFLAISDILQGGTNAAQALSGLNYIGRWNQDLEVTVTAIANDSRARILQRPRIQTSHAVEANLFVGESRPYPTASYYGGGGYGGYSSIQQVQIGVTLSVTPLINPDGLVVMDIHQTIENAQGDVKIENVGNVPITSRKEAAAKVAVRDRDTIILGGLIENSTSKATGGVPFLKDIPLLGFLFRSTSDKNQRNELIVLIRPTVLPTPEVAALTAISEKDKMPGIRKAEAEMKAQEEKWMQQAEKEVPSR